MLEPLLVARDRNKESRRCGQGAGHSSLASEKERQRQPVTNRNSRSKAATNLRQKAEALARKRTARTAEDSATLSSDEIRETLHELRGRQIEMEMQNEELRTAQAQIEAGRARYFDLYDLAPVGYCTLSEQGLILEANLTAATLLGTTRSLLVKRPISRFILKDDQDIHYLHRKKLFETGKPQEYELRLVTPDGALFWAHLAAIAARAEDGAPLFRVVLSDITDRKQAEKSLEESQRFFQFTLNALSTHIAVLDDRGEIIFTNKAYRDFAERNGIDPRAVSEGTNYLAVCDIARGEYLEEAGLFAQGIREVLSGNRPSFELEYPCHSPDDQRWFIGRVAPIQDKGRQRVVVAHENITERKQAEMALRESEERFRSYIEHSPYGVFVTDGQGRYVDVNPSAERITGYSTAQLTSMSIPDLLTEESRESGLGHFHALVAAGRASSELAFRRADGSLGYWSVSATRIGPDRYLGFVEDVSERKRADDTLWQSRVILQAILDNIPVRVFWKDLDLNYLGCNMAFARDAGIEDPQHLVGKNDFAMGWREQAELFRRDDREVIETGNPKLLIAEPQTTPSGKTIHLLTSKVPLRNAHGAVIGVLGTYMDISELKQAEEQARKLELDLRHSQKLEAIGQLAAGIAHEINTPAQFVGDNTRFLEDAFAGLFKLFHVYQELEAACAKDGMHAELLNRIQGIEAEAETDYLATEIPKALEQSLEGIDRIARIIRAMKDFSHPGGTEKAEANLNHAIETTVVVARNEWKYVADMETDLNSDLPLVPCFVGEINQVFLNLIVNAAHAIEAMGVKESGRKGTIRISTRRHEEFAEIRISDSGMGIAPEHRSRIFEPFFTTKVVGKGTGQGLALAYQIVTRRHGGTITFETETGKGTTFIIRLPMGDTG